MNAARVLAALCAGLALAAPAGAARILLIGDSITHGKMDSRAKRASWAERVARAFPEHEVVNAGCPGSSSTDWVTPGPALSCAYGGAFEKLAAPHLPAEVVTILLGANDAMGLLGGPTSPERYRANLEGLIERLLPQTGTILLLTPTSLGSAKHDARIKIFREVVLDLCRKPGDRVLCGPDFYGRLRGQEVHPTARGHRRIARAVVSQLRLVLTRLRAEEILDRILVPRPNGSAALFETADILEGSLTALGAEVSRHAFTATPHGFQLTWSVVLLLLFGWAAALLARRNGLALLLAAPAPLILLLEFEWMVSTVSALWPLTEHNVVGTFPGAPGGPTLVFSAHYDTATHFGDHFTWGRWGWRLGPATGVALGLPLLAWLLGRWRRAIPRAVLAALAALTVLPFGAMWWFHAAGPVLREPSPGAVDNGGSMTALLQLAERLESRPAGAPTTVQIVFLAAEEERAMGSWAYAETLAGRPGVAVVNLESIGASDELAVVVEDGWATRRVESPPQLVAFVNDAARDELGAPLPELALPEGVLTDGRSFLARGVPAVTLRALIDGAFPRRLHSVHDSRDRLSVAGIERAAAFLRALVARADADPDELLDF